MKNSKAIVLSILIIIVFSLSLSALSAQAIDDDSTIMVEVDNGTEDIGDIDSLAADFAGSNDSLGQIYAENRLNGDDEEEEEISDFGSFTDLQSEISNAESNITLNKDYLFNYSTGFSFNGIDIDKNLTINGDGHVIDSQGLCRIFQINENTLILNNITFIASQATIANARSSLDLAGGAVYAFNSALIIENCSFVSFGAMFGGAICSLKTNLSLNNVSFVNCSAEYYGGAVYHMYGNLRASMSSFTNCSAIDGGGIFADCLDSLNIADTDFYANNASLLGGAVFSNEIADLLIEDCNFSSNAAAYANKSYVDINEEEKVLNYYGENLLRANCDYTGYDVYNQAKYDLYIFYDNDYELFYNNGTVISEFPERYDLREEGFVSSVKNQGNGGNCWAFSAMAALESAILKATNGTVCLDLSEENLKNIMACYSPFGTTYEPNEGGNDRLSNAYFAAWLGPVLESEDDYNANDYLSAIFDPYTHIQNILWIDRNNYTDNDGIKYALLNYGAVSVSCYFSSTFANGSSYYYTGGERRNHAVTIVGWDDNYSASNFKTKAPGDGAWIFKNSWGTNSGDGGYYYASYYDTCFAIGHQEAFCYVLNNSVKYEKMYQYDIVGMTDWLYNESAVNGIWYKNLFNSTDDEVLAAFSTFFNKETNYTAYVYVNGELVHAQNGSASNGYFTIKLSKYIPLKKGDKFEIVMKVLSDGISVVPISESTASMRDYALEGVSFFSFDGVNWMDLCYYSGEYYENGQRSHWYENNMMACLKAFTLSKINISNIVGFKVFDEAYDVGDVVNVTFKTPIDFIAMIADEYGDLANSGVFKIAVGDEEYVIDEGCRFTLMFNNTGIHKVFFTAFDGLDVYYNLSGPVELAILNVTAIPTAISFENSLLENYASCLKVSVSDGNGDSVHNGSVCFEVLDSNGNSVLRYTSLNPNFTFGYYLDPGVYSILINFTSSDANYLNAFTTGSLDINQRPAEISYSYAKIYAYPNSEYFIIALKDSATGKALANKYVQYKFDNGKINTVKTDANGIVKIKISVNGYGNYSMQVIFMGDGQFKAAAISKTLRVYKNSVKFTGATKKIKKSKSKRTFKIALKTSNNKALSSKYVYLTINKRTYKVKTGSKGLASFKIKLPNLKKTYKYKVHFKGDKANYAKTYTAKLKVY